MNSLNKHVPTLVFLLGFGLLAYSIHTFFSIGKKPQLTPLANGPSVVVKGPLVKAEGNRLSFKVAPPAQHSSRVDPREPFEREMKRPALEYLERVGIKMRVPDGFSFAEESDGNVQILMGASEPMKVDFYVFSAQGKYPLDRAMTYLKQYFADTHSVAPKGAPQPVRSRGSVSNMMVIKGLAGKSEFQAYFFINKKTDQTHLLMLMNRNLLKAPARVRELVDSING